MSQSGSHSEGRLAGFGVRHPRLVATALVGARFLAESGTPPTLDRPYVLVVPFGVSDNATEYHRTFADQLTREVIDSLRKISGLRTVPQASAFRFRNDRA